MELNENSFEVPPRWQRGGPSYRARESAARRGRHHFAPRGLRATATLIGLSLGIAVYGVAASRDAVAAIGLAAVVLAVAALARAARGSIRTLERRCDVLGRARAESERARHDLEVENAELERRNADLEAEHAAIFDGFDWVDEQTAGRLRALLEAAGLELADLTDMVLDEPEADA